MKLYIFDPMIGRILRQHWVWTSNLLHYRRLPNLCAIRHYKNCIKFKIAKHSTAKAKYIIVITRGAKTATICINIGNAIKINNPKKLQNPVAVHLIDTSNISFVKIVRIWLKEALKPIESSAKTKCHVLGIHTLEMTKQQLVISKDSTIKVFLLKNLISVQVNSNPVICASDERKTAKNTALSLLQFNRSW